MMMKTAAECKSRSKHKRDAALRLAYTEVCRRFGPVFHHFFLERFSESPALWFRRRTTYTRSVAASSIVGYIMGIGDRHSQNILVHQRTAELGA